MKNLRRGFLFLLLCCGGAAAQNIAGVILGTVADASGAVIPGASVTITNLATNQTTVVTSNADSDNVSVLIGNGTGNFATSKEYAAGKYPVAVLVADFNADGRPDVVTANADAGTLSFLQGSAVTAGALNTARALTACASPSSLFATDLNGDGKLDLLTACADAASVAYLLGKGDGTFNPAKLIPVCDFPSDVQAAQLSETGLP